VGLRGVQGADTDDAFRQLFERNEHAVSQYVLRRVGPRDDAGDVVAETFVVAWRKRGDVPAPPEDRFWLLGVARRQLSTQVRRETRVVRLHNRLRSERTEAPASEDTPPEVELVDAVIAELSELDREIFRLYCWERLTQEEIATVLGTSRKAVERRMARARERVRMAIDPQARGIEPGPNSSTPVPRLAAGEGTT
jgi:RNA polymerase sigma factor (sigma-70 family)